MDYIKDRYAFLSILSLNGRHVIVEKATNIKNLRSEWGSDEIGWLEENNRRKIAESSSNMKLWKTIALVQGFKNDAVKYQKFEDAAFLRDVERNCAEILYLRRDLKELP